MRLIDPNTGKPPMLRRGDTLDLGEWTLVDGVDSTVPDALDEEGNEVRYTVVT